MTTSEDLQAQNEDLQEEPVLDETPPLGEIGEVKEDKKKNPLMILAVAIAAVVMVFALVVLFYASQYTSEGETGEETTQTEATQKTASSTGDENLDMTIDAQYVVKESEWHHYNGNLDENGNPKKTVQTVKKVAAPAEEQRPTSAPGEEPAAATPASTVTPPPKPAVFSLASLVGLDEDEAVAKAKKEGYVVYSVYVCDSAAVKGKGAKAPKAGRVLGTTDYTMRKDGEKNLFLLVATSESYSKAKAVPNVVGMAWKDARAALSKVGIGTRYAYERKSADTKGKVLFQAAPEGSYIPSGSTIVLVLADD